MRRLFLLGFLALVAMVNIGCHNSLKSSMEQMDAPIDNRDCTTNQQFQREHDRLWSSEEQFPPMPIRVHGSIES